MRVLKGTQEKAHQIIEMDPTHEKMAASQRATNAPTDRLVEFGHGSLPGLEDDAGPNQHPAHLALEGSAGFFPSLAKGPEKIVGGGSGLIHGFIAGIAVPSNRRGSEENPGWGSARQTCPGEVAG